MTRHEKEQLVLLEAVPVADRQHEDDSDGGDHPCGTRHAVIVKDRRNGPDLWPTSAKRDEQVKRAIGLGAVVLDDRRREDGTGWVVFADPEGNEFCIGRSAAERAAGAH